MNDINNVNFTGRLTRDPELKYTKGGTAILNFAAASNYSVKNGDQWEDRANFFDCVIFGKRAEALNKYLAKGVRVNISGELRQERWDQDGQPRSRVVIIVGNVIADSAKPAERNAQVAEPVRQVVNTFAPNVEPFDDDIPF